MRRQLVFLGLAAAVWAQSRTPAFEAATVRPVGPTELPSGLSIDGARFRIGGFSLQSVILQAYQIKEYQLTGPAWLASERFVIEAALPRGATEDQVPAMLQGLLAERFLMKAKRVTRQQTVYAVVVDRGGLKMQEQTGSGSTPPAEPAAFRAFSGSMFMTKPGDWKFALAGGDLEIVPGANGMHLQASRVSSLVQLLSLCTDKPVVDRTNLQGSYRIEFDITDDRMDDLVSAVMAPPGANAGAPEPMDAGLLRQVLRGLGLNVEQRSEPVETLVIDSIAKTPTAN